MLVDLGKVPFCRVEHTIHELLNHLLDYSDEAKSMLDDLRDTYTPNSNVPNLDLRVVF
jgi:hypothetical protein